MDELNLLKNDIQRYFDETTPLIGQLNNDILNKVHSSNIRNIEELVLHMIRSLEYYLNGVILEKWEYPPYTSDKFDNSNTIINLYDTVKEQSYELLNRLNQDHLNKIFSQFTRKCNGMELLREMLDHNIHHRGQLIVLYRLEKIEPVKIPYIIE